MIGSMTSRAQPNHFIRLGVVFVMALYVFVAATGEAGTSNDRAISNPASDLGARSTSLWVSLPVFAGFLGVKTWVSEPEAARVLKMLLAVSPIMLAPIFQHFFLVGKIIPAISFANLFSISFVMFVLVGASAHFTCGLEPISRRSVLMKLRDRLRLAAFATLFGGHGDYTSGACLNRLHPVGASFYHEMIGWRY